MPLSGRRKKNFSTAPTVNLLDGHRESSRALRNECRFGGPVLGHVGMGEGNDGHEILAIIAADMDQAEIVAGRTPVT